MHTNDLTDSQPPAVADNCLPHPHLPLHTEPCLPAAHSDSGTQTVTVTHTAVQTDDSNIPVIPSTSHHSMITMTSSEFDQKMEHMMATALLNAKDTVNTIEALSQSLLLKNVSRENSFATLPVQQQLTSTQYVANNQGVANSQDVVNTPRMTTILELTNPHASRQYTSNQMDTSTHVTPSGHTSRSHANHMTPQHSYTLYDSGHHEDNSLYLTR